MKHRTPAFASWNAQEHLPVMSTWARVQCLHNQRLLRSIEVKLIEVKPPNMDVFFRWQALFFFL
jgi:hypothetical protein